MAYAANKMAVSASMSQTATRITAILLLANARMHLHRISWTTEKNVSWMIVSVKAISALFSAVVNNKEMAQNASDLKNASPGTATLCFATLYVVLNLFLTDKHAGLIGFIALRKSATKDFVD